MHISCANESRSHRKRGGKGGGREKGVRIKIRTFQSVTCLKFEIQLRQIEI